MNAIICRNFFESSRRSRVHTFKFRQMWVLTSIILDSATGVILSIGKIYEKAHIPVGISFRNDIIDRRALNEWWRGRAIPTSRIGIQAALKEMDSYEWKALSDKGRERSYLAGAI